MIFAPYFRLLLTFAVKLDITIEIWRYLQSYDTSITEFHECLALNKRAGSFLLSSLQWNCIWLSGTCSVSKLVEEKIVIEIRTKRNFMHPYLILAGTELIFFLVSGTVLWLWIQDENDIDNTLIFWLWLSSANPVSRTFQCFVSGEVHKAGRRQGQDRWPELARGILHTIECPARYINCKNYPEEDNCCLGMGWAAGSEKIVPWTVLCITCFSLVLLPSLCWWLSGLWWWGFSY